ncbi:hypothetical protein [Cochlodiniinecator piscidefendens]|uniref:hypothetical protein n=1 Tax=Cochlodiniinecator piscidefendens TaxID=2715756 RepID=UPI00140CA115|nr:hypothetical protein [Cochlodiniinecator piscidefendens]
MKKQILMLTFAVGAIFIATQQAFAQDPRNCAPRNVILERLADNYGETRQSIGLGRNNAVIEVFASTETGTWTITVTLPNGMTCMIAAGQAFETLAEVLPEETHDA